MAQDRTEKLLRWGNVHTEPQRQKIREQTAQAIQDLVNHPARTSILKDIPFKGESWINEGNGPVLNKNGVALKHSRYRESFEVLWDGFRLLIGYPVKDPALKVGWEVGYDYLETLEQYADMAELFKISAKDVLELRSKIED